MRPYPALAFLFLFLPAVTQAQAETAVEPWTYSEDFETREACAWASYPLWQDTAYDDNFYAGELVRGDANVSIVQYVKPYVNRDCYAGAQKKLDMYLVPASEINLRYYLKTHLEAEYLKLRIACGELGKADVTIGAPATNGWTDIAVSWNDILAENPRLSGRERLKIEGIAVLAKIPEADPDMPVWFGLDDVAVAGAREVPFAFATPEVYVLPEWKEYIPKRHYSPGETLTLKGEWEIGADSVTLSLSPFTDGSTVLKSLRLNKSGAAWSGDLKLDYAPGLYLGTLTAAKNGETVAETEFTVYIAPPSPGEIHPRLWFGEEKRRRIVSRLKDSDCSGLAAEMAKAAEKAREDFPLENMVYDFDQFPDTGWLTTRYAWSLERIRSVGEAAHYNALAYSLLGDREAGEYARQVLVRYAAFPSWNHPWMLKRGRYSYLLIGDMAMYFGLSYDLVHDLCSAGERDDIRNAFLENYIIPTHRSYVYRNMITSNTSNWIAAIIGGSIVCQSAIYGESDESAVMEPYFTGAVLKMNALVQHSIGSDGGYGEGYGYYAYSSRSWSKSLPALENVYHVDISAKLNGVYDELVWAGQPRERTVYYFGDSSSSMLAMNAWAWLLEKYPDPTLAWLYRVTSAEARGKENGDTIPGGSAALSSLIEKPTLEDLIYDIGSVTAKEPSENPVRLFRDIGTTVFRSGWGTDDFVFVLRTGAFYNHQHLDQGSFWLADKGQVFIGEHYGSSYYGDPLFETHYTAPIGHSTIMLDKNGNGQRTGDPLHFIDGFDDHAYVCQFLDGEKAAFSSGDVSGLYWGKAESIRRNVLYLKPRTLLMLDSVVPGKTDVEVTPIFQTRYLDEITAGNEMSTITRDGVSLMFSHLNPVQADVEAVGLPHFLHDFDKPPFRRRGYLSVSARTNRNPLLIANLISTDSSLMRSLETVRAGNAVIGRSGSLCFAFPETPGKLYSVDGMKTDALAVTWSDDTVFAAMATVLERNGKVIVKSNAQFTCEVSGSSVKLYTAEDAEITVGDKIYKLGAGEKKLPLK